MYNILTSPSVKFQQIERRGPGKDRCLCMLTGTWALMRSAEWAVLKGIQCIDIFGSVTDLIIGK